MEDRDGLSCREHVHRTSRLLLDVIFGIGAAASASALHWVAMVDRRIPLGSSAAIFLVGGVVVLGAAIKFVRLSDVRLFLIVLASVAIALVLVPVPRVELLVRDEACRQGSGFACYESDFIRNRILRGRRLYRYSRVEVTRLLSLGCERRARPACMRLMIRDD